MSGPPPPVPDGLHVCVRTCVYCGTPIYGRSNVCREHRDLLALDVLRGSWIRRTSEGWRTPKVDAWREQS